MFSIVIQRHKSAAFVKSALWLKRWTPLLWYIPMNEGPNWKSAEQICILILLDNGRWNLILACMCSNVALCTNSAYICFSLASGWARASIGNVQLCCMYARLWNKCRYEQPLHTNRTREFSPTSDRHHFNCDYRNFSFYQNLGCG